MKAAIMRYRERKAVKLPLRAQVHMVAARYGQSPAAVRDWPADDFKDALLLEGLTGG